MYLIVERNAIDYILNVIFLKLETDNAQQFLDFLRDAYEKRSIQIISNKSFAFLYNINHLLTLFVNDPQKTHVTVIYASQSIFDTCLIMLYQKGHSKDLEKVIQDK